MRPIGPYSRPESLASISGRTREGRIVRGVRADLTAHVGGNPSATQRVLIERAAMLTLQIALMDAKHAAAGVTQHDGPQYLAWVNTLTRIMAQLGLDGAPTKPVTLEQHLARKASKSPAP